MEIRTMSSPYSGIMPVAPVPFHEDGSVDYEGNKRVLDCMIDQGVDGICILANYSEQFLLTDEERSTLTRQSLEHVAARVPVIVTTSHFSTDIAAARGKEAAQMGASMLMMMPPYHGRFGAGPTEIIEHFDAVAKAADLPIMVQDAPLSGVELSVSLLVELCAKVPLVQYFKIEVPFAAAKLRTLIAQGGAAIKGPFDGEEAITLMADLDAGATGTMTSALIPDLIRSIVVAHREGRRVDALSQWQHVLPTINFENRQCGLRACKVAMKEGGVIKSDRVRHPLKQLHPDTKAGLLELLTLLDPIVLRWGK